MPSREEIFAAYPVNPRRGPQVTREAWIESLVLPEYAAAEDQGEDESQLIQLHPEIWSVRPRIDIIKKNVDWQADYKKVRFEKALNKYEMPFGMYGRPWPQKGSCVCNKESRRTQMHLLFECVTKRFSFFFSGTGRARHASIRTSQWNNGGKCFGPRGLKSYYYMLPMSMRVLGLVHTLSAKFAQDDVHFVKDLEIPDDEPEYVEKLIEERSWGISTLFVGVEDIFPEKLTAALTTINHVNMLPVYGLNVQSMLKHKNLVLSVDALSYLENRLLYHLHRPDGKEIRERSHDYFKHMLT